MIKFSCPGCDVTIRVADEKAGKRGKCPKCGTVLTVPSQGESNLDDMVLLGLTDGTAVVEQPPAAGEIPLADPDPPLKQTPSDRTAGKADPRACPRCGHGKKRRPSRDDVMGWIEEGKVLGEFRWIFPPLKECAKCRHLWQPPASLPVLVICTVTSLALIVFAVVVEMAYFAQLEDSRGQDMMAKHLAYITLVLGLFGLVLFCFCLFSWIKRAIRGRTR